MTRLWLGGMWLCLCAAAQPVVYHFDARKAEPAVAPGRWDLATNSKYFVRGGKPWYPVMGEIHYTRYPRTEWDEALRKMKAGGVDVVATYFFWLHHEEVEGVWEWTGNKSLRQFLELCKKHGLFAFVRLGPWSHGEAKNGGHPDWLLTKGWKLRSNDPRYLERVKGAYEQIFEQCRGLLYKEGGPVIGVQVENELTNDPEHLRTLKKMARDAGFDVPFYTATAWMNAQLPGKELLPVWAAYADMPWEKGGRAAIPPGRQYLFDSGADLFGKYATPPEGVPIAMAELGGGVQVTEWRRPVLSAKDIVSLAYVSLGKGANLLGYYMYHGGSQPEGKTTLTGEPGCPRVSYDFQAPLGEFGDARPHYHDLRALHLFARDFAKEITATSPVIPNEKPAGPTDTSKLRVALRAGAQGGFVVWNNYHRGLEMKDQGPLQFSVQTKTGELVFPRQPVTIPRDAFGIWPYQLKLGTVSLRYATAQPLAMVTGGDGDPTYFFVASEGVTAEYEFDPKSEAGLQSTCGQVITGEGATRVLNLRPGSGCVIVARTLQRRRVRIVTLAAEQAREFWKAPIGGREYGFLSKSALQFEGDTVTAESEEGPALSVGVYPALNLTVDRVPPVKRADPVFTWYGVKLRPKQTTAAVKQLGSKTWLITPRGSEDARLEIAYTGDTARLYTVAGENLIADDLYTGKPWSVGLKRFAASVMKDGAVLEIVPLKKDANIFLEQWPAMLGSEVAEVKSVRAVPMYRAVLRVKDRPAGKR